MPLVAEAWNRGFCARRFASSVEPLRGRPEMKQYFLRVIFPWRSPPGLAPPRPARDGPRIDGILPGAPARVNTPPDSLRAGASVMCPRRGILWLGALLKGNHALKCKGPPIPPHLARVTSHGPSGICCATLGDSR